MILEEIADCRLPIADLHGQFGIACERYKEQSTKHKVQNTKHKYQGRAGGFLRPGLASIIHCLKHVSDSDDHSAVTAVRIPLSQETGRRHHRIRSTEVTRVGEIEKVGPKLQPLVLTNLRVFQQAEIDVIQTIGTQAVATRITDTLTVNKRTIQSIS